MGRRRERTSWTRVDLLQDRRARGPLGGGVRTRRNSSSTGGARVAKLQPEVIEKELISEFSCVEVRELEELSNGFTKIRSKNLDIIFRRDFYKKKMMMMMTNPGGCQETSGYQSAPAVTFDKLDLDEIPEFRPRMASDDSGYSSSLQEVQCPPHCPQYPPYHHQTGPQFYLYSPCSNTLIPCEEIILSPTILSPEGPQYQEVYEEAYQPPSKAYVAYPVQGPGGPGYITQPFTGPGISSSPETPSEDPAEPGEAVTGSRPPSEQEDRRGPPPGPVKQTQPGIKQLSKNVSVLASRHIPGLAVEKNKTKKRRKKKSKSKHSADQLKAPLSSSDSEAREARRDVEVTEDLFSFQYVEASETQVKLTDYLTNSLVNPPTDEDDTEIPTNAQFSFNEAVLINVSKSSAEILLQPSLEEFATPKEAGVEKPPEKPSSVGKPKNKSRKKKPKRAKVEVNKETEPMLPPPVKELDTGKSEVKSTEAASKSLQAPELEEVREEAVPTIEAEGETATTEEPVDLEKFETKPRTSPSTPVKPSREMKSKGRGRRTQSSQPPLQRVLVNDDEVGVRHCQPSFQHSVQSDGEERVLVSRYDLLVVRELGHGMTRGVMDLERPFLGSFVPPDHQQNQPDTSNPATSTTVLELKIEENDQDVNLNRNELLPLD